MKLLDRLQLRVLARLLRLPTPLARRLAGPTARTEGYPLDLRTQVFCRLSELYNPTEARDDALIPQRRREQDALSPLISGPMPVDVAVEPFTLHLSGRALRAEVLRPPGDELPALLWLHGGGFVMGSLDTHRASLAQLARRARCTIVHVAYRLAPEHRFPAAHDDALESWLHLLDLAPTLRLGPLAIGGDSAGANLAASVCARCHDEGHPAPRLQVLVYPAVDSSTEHPSYAELRTGFFMTRTQVRWYIERTISSPADRLDPRMSPLLRADLRGLAPALLLTAGFDVLRDEGRAYAQRLAEAGALRAHLHEPTLIHGFLNFTGVVEACQAGLDRLAQRIGEELRRPPPPDPAHTS